MRFRGMTYLRFNGPCSGTFYAAMSLGGFRVFCVLFIGWGMLFLFFSGGGILFFRELLLGNSFMCIVGMCRELSEAECVLLTVSVVSM